MIDIIPLDLLEPWSDGDILEAISRAYTRGPYMTELLFMSMLWVGVGLAMYIHTGGIGVPVVLTIIFVGVIAGMIGGTMASFVVVAMIILIPGLLMLLLRRGSG